MRPDDVRRAGAGLLLLLSFGFAGCVTSQRNQIYFAAADLNETDARLKFYRLTLRTRAMNSKAQLTTGFYSANAVRDLMGEVNVKESETYKSEEKDAAAPAKPGDGKTAVPDTSKSDKSTSPPPSTGVPGPSNYYYDADEGRWKKSGEDQLFTIVYGTNADEIASQIKAFYTGQKTGDMLGKLFESALLGGDFMKAQEAEGAVEGSKANLANAGEALKKSADGLEDGAGATAIDATLNGAIQTVLAALLAEQRSN